jgi:hypothetical protein
MRNSREVFAMDLQVFEKEHLPSIVGPIDLGPAICKENDEKATVSEYRANYATEIQAEGSPVLVVRRQRAVENEEIQEHWNNHKQAGHGNNRPKCLAHYASPEESVCAENSRPSNIELSCAAESDPLNHCN